MYIVVIFIEIQNHSICLNNLLHKHLDPGSYSKQYEDIHRRNKKRGLYQSHSKAYEKWDNELAQVTNGY